ncbi:winged helix-turn-helix transcriptional regulator [Rickettsiales bacterium LUAb2]
MTDIKKYKHNDRSYCPLAYALDLIGDHWTILIIRNMLFFNQHEFKEFLTMPEKISTNILSNRLAKLLKYNLIAVIIHPNDKKRKLYYLTKSGKQFINVIIEIFMWVENNLIEIGCDKEETSKFIQNIKEYKQKYLNELEAWEKTNLL